MALKWDNINKFKHIGKHIFGITGSNRETRQWEALLGDNYGEYIDNFICAYGEELKKLNMNYNSFYSLDIKKSFSIDLEKKYTDISNEIVDYANNHNDNKVLVYHYKSGNSNCLNFTVNNSGVANKLTVGTIGGSKAKTCYFKNNFEATGIFELAGAVYYMQNQFCLNCNYSYMLNNKNHNIYYYTNDLKILSMISELFEFDIDIEGYPSGTIMEDKLNYPLKLLHNFFNSLSKNSDDEDEIYIDIYKTAASIFGTNHYFKCRGNDYIIKWSEEIFIKCKNNNFAPALMNEEEILALMIYSCSIEKNLFRDLKDYSMTYKMLYKMLERIIYNAE